MSWSYRADQADSVYNQSGGPATVSGGRASAHPADGTPNTADVGAPINLYATDAAVTIATQRAVFTKGSAIAATLAAPTAAQAGIQITLISGTAFAHVVTATGLIDDGVTGGGKNTITLGAFVGACAVVMAYGLHWVLVSKTVATVA